MFYVFILSWSPLAPLMIIQNCVALKSNSGGGGGNLSQDNPTCSGSTASPPEPVPPPSIAAAPPPGQNHHLVLLGDDHHRHQHPHRATPCTISRPLATPEAYHFTLTPPASSSTYLSSSASISVSSSTTSNLLQAYPHNHHYQHLYSTFNRQHSAQSPPTSHQVGSILTSASAQSPQWRAQSTPTNHTRTEETSLVFTPNTGTSRQRKYSSPLNLIQRQGCNKYKTGSEEEEDEEEDDDEEDEVDDEFDQNSVTSDLEASALYAQYNYHLDQFLAVRKMVESGTPVGAAVEAATSVHRSATSVTNVGTTRKNRTTSSRRGRGNRGGSAASAADRNNYSQGVRFIPDSYPTSVVGRDSIIVATNYLNGAGGAGAGVGYTLADDTSSDGNYQNALLLNSMVYQNQLQLTTNHHHHHQHQQQQQPNHHQQHSQSAQHLQRSFSYTSNTSGGLGNNNTHHSPSSTPNSNGSSSTATTILYDLSKQTLASLDETAAERLLIKEEHLEEDEVVGDRSGLVVYSSPSTPTVSTACPTSSAGLFTSSSSSTFAAHLDQQNQPPLVADSSATSFEYVNNISSTGNNKRTPLSSTSCSSMVCHRCLS